MQLGKSRTGRLWVYVRDDRNAGIGDAGGVVARELTGPQGPPSAAAPGRYSGVLQANAYGGYNALYENGRITEAAGIAHARRRIHDIHARTLADTTTEALRRIFIQFQSLSC